MGIGVVDGGVAEIQVVEDEWMTLACSLFGFLCICIEI